MHDTKFKRVSWDDVEQACRVIHEQMLRDGYRPDVLIGLLRGGIVPARIFSDMFDILIDFFALDVKLYDGVNSRRDKPVIRSFFSLDEIQGCKKILVVDDIWDSGKTMNAVLDMLKGRDVTTATVFWKEGAEKMPDYCHSIAAKDEWIVFPWDALEFKRETENQMRGQEGRR